MSDTEMQTTGEEPGAVANDDVKTEPDAHGADTQPQDSNPEPDTKAEAADAAKRNTDDEGDADADVEAEPDTAVDEQPDGVADELPSDPVEQDSAKQSPVPPENTAQGGPYKSYRKKYRKMRMKFEAVMEEANNNFVHECEQWDLAKRLKEQNDQLLDIVTDILLDNRSTLDPASQSAYTALDRRLNLETLERDILHTPYNYPDESVLPKDLADLDVSNVEETMIDSKSPKDGPLPALKNFTYCDYDPKYATPPGYLTLEHEEAYLAELDASLSALPPTDKLPTGVETVQPRYPPFKRMLLTEEDFMMRNPISVHNWLRRNQPQIFEAPKEREKMREEREAYERSKLTSESKPGKKGQSRQEQSISKQDQPFQGLDDEIGFDPTVDPPALGSTRGKKRKDDEAYRPKGGHSRGGKRKRDKEDGDFKGKTGKRAKTSSAAAADDAG